MNAVIKPKMNVAGTKTGRVPAGKKSTNVTPIRMVPVYLTKREQMLTDAANLGRSNFKKHIKSEFIPDPIKCDLDMMEAYQQGMACQALDMFGTSRYIVG